MLRFRQRWRDVRCRAADSLALLAAIAGPLALYAATLPRGVVLEDDGLFLMAGEHIGIAHPPGYPVYTVLLHLFMQLPFGSPAVLGHLLSAVLGAMACGAVFLCARLLGATVLPALTAAWVFAASEHVWSQAIITEVYTLNALLFFSIYALLLYGGRPEGVPLRPLVAAALLYGLSLANHWPLTVLAAPGLALALLPAWKTAWRRLPLLFGLAAASAALPYVWMVWRSQQDPLISFYGPLRILGSISDTDSLLYYLARRGYAGIDVSASAGWGDRWAYLQWFGGEVVSQLTVVGLVAASCGLILLLRHRRHWEACSGIVVFLAHSVLLIALLNFDYDYLYVSVFRPYSLVCYGLAGLWLAVGFQRGLEQFPFGQLVGSVRGGGVRLAAAVLGCLALTAWNVQGNWHSNDRSGSNIMQREADLVLNNLPENAVFVAFGDLEVAPYGYYRYVENRRPDITLMSKQGIALGDRLYNPFTPQERQAELMQEFVATTDRPVLFFNSNDYNFVCGGCRTRHYGYAVEALSDGRPPGELEMVRVAEAEAFFRDLVDTEVTDAWEYRKKASFMHNFGRYLGLLAATANPVALQIAEPLLPYAEREYHCLVGMVNSILPHWNEGNAERTTAWAERMERLLAEARLTKRELGLHHFLRGSVELKRGHRTAAASMFRRSLDRWDHPNNEAHKALHELGGTLGRRW